VDDELLTALAEALREHGVANARAVLAVADVAVRILGRDRCVCRRAVHDAHHAATVERCPYCSPGTMPAPRRGRRSTEVVPTQGLL
jgi:hypothetical protein